MRHFSGLLALAVLLAAPLAPAQDLEVLPEDASAEGSEDDDRPPPASQASTSNDDHEPGSGSADEEDSEASNADADALGGAFQVGLRLGFAFPSGDVDEGSGSATNRMADTFTGQVPIWLDVGYRFNAHWVAGVWGLYGVTLMKEAEPGVSGGCPPGADCSASNIRLGLEVAYHISPLSSWDPWVGVGFGYTMLDLEVTAEGQTFTGSYSGFEPFNFQVGLDAPSEDGKQAVGIFLAYSLGQFNKGEVTVGNVTESGDITRPTSHSWLTLGIRGTADF